MSEIAITTPTVEELVEKYIALRDAKAAMKRAYDDAKSKVEAEMYRIEGTLLERMNEAGVESMRANSGTAYKTTKTYATVVDRAALRGYVESTGNWEVMTVSANAKVITDLMETSGEEVPGVNLRREIAVNIRR